MGEPDVHNEISSPVPGAAIQAGTVFGGIHVHPIFARVVPRQLPAGIPNFVGRIRELNILTEQVSEAGIAVISGTPGVGKTALAVHWGRQHLDRFPDGQLYVNLNGFNPVGVPTPPAVAVRTLLDSFQIPVEMIPGDVAAQAALYRSLVDQKRILIVLDNARDSDQIRPLLPGSRTCHVLVTSRQQLPGLVAAEQARHMILDVLSTDEAQRLLAQFLGMARIRAESAAVDELIKRCARLPVALVIAAARAVTDPYLRLDTLAAELDELSTGDGQGTDIRTVFSWSYNALSAAAARLFRLVGLHPGPDIDIHAAASLVGASVPRARAMLAELTAAHLLQEHTAGRYRFHDLLRAYAVQRGAEEDAEHQWYALCRVFDYYLHTGFAADQRINPDRQPITLDDPHSEVSPLEIINDNHAWEWLTAERSTLLAAIDHANQSRFNRHAWQLAWVMATFLDRRGHWPECAAAHETALTAVTRLGDRPGQARIHRFLGWAYTRLGHYDEALTHLQAALTLWQELDDIRGQASARHGLSLLDQWQDNYTQALEHARQALDLSHGDRDVTGEATALNTLGWNHARLGDYDQAMVDAQRALNLFRQLDDQFGQAEALDILAYAHRHLGQLGQACSSYQECLALRRRLGDHYQTASALFDLGEVYCAIGQFKSARDMWQQSLTILKQLGHPQARSVLAKLNNLRQ